MREPRLGSGTSRGTTPRGSKQPPLSPGESRLVEQIVAERAERFRAVNEVWEKLRELQTEVRSASQQPPGRNADSQAQRGSPPLTARGESSEQRQRIEGRSLVPLLEQSKMPSLEPSEAGGDDVRQTLVQLKRLIQITADSTDQSNTRLQEVQDQQLKAETRLDVLDRQFAELKATTQGRATALGSVQLVQGESDPFGIADAGDFGGKIDRLRTGLESTQQFVYAIQEKEKARDRDLVDIKEMVYQTYDMLPMQAVKSSRVALQAVKMSEQERAQALRALDETEASMRGRGGVGGSRPGSPSPWGKSTFAV